MVGRYEVSDLDVEDILVFAPNAHVDLGYTPYPSQFELEQEILAGVHTNPHGEIGCPVCGCIDLFLKERTAKGVRYRCMSCMYATESEFESVKSRKDITLAQFGLGFECAICGEDIDSYNHDTVMRHVRKCRQNQNQNFSAENMMLELGQQDPDDPDRMWGPDIISPIFPFKGYERPTEEVRAELKKHLVGQEIRMYGPQNESEARAIKQPMDWWKDVGFSEFQPLGTMGKVTGVSMSNPNQPKIIGVWVTIISGGSPNHPIGSRVWFHVKDSYFPDSLSLGWTQGDYVGNPVREQYLRGKGITKGFEAPYQPSQTLADYSPEMLKYSSTVTGDFFWDSLKFGQTTRNAEEELADLTEEDLKEISYQFLHGGKPRKDTDIWAEETKWIRGNPVQKMVEQGSLVDDVEEALIGTDWFQTRNEASYDGRFLDNFYDSGFWGVERLSTEIENGTITPQMLQASLDVCLELDDEMFEAEDKPVVPRYVYHATPHAYWEQIKEQGGMTPQIGYMTYRAFLPRYKKAHIGQDISPEHYKQWLVKELEGLKIWATGPSKVAVYATMIAPMSFLRDNVILKIDTEGLDFEYYDYDEFFTQKPIPLSAIELEFMMDGERSDEEYPDYLLPNLDPSLQSMLEDEPELLETHPEWFRDELYERFVAAAEENQSDLHIWDEEAGLFYDYIEVPQPDGELIVVYWILNEELDQVGKAQISLFNNNLEIDSIFIEPYYQRRGIATSFVNHVVNYWDSELLTFSDTVSDEGVAFVDSFAAEDNYDSTYGVKQAKIRRRLKKKIKKQAIMGTKAGQWSARKSQELKRQYEAACQRAGLKPYKGQKTKKQQDLTDWSKQGWRTASGKKSSTTGEPYFPAKAVAALKQKGLYAKAKKQKQAATKAGKQNARYSDDIRKVVAKYRAEGVNMKKLDYYQNVLDKSVFPFTDIEWETGDETIAEKLTKRDYSWQDEVEWTSWTPDESKLSKTFVFTDDDPWVELWNLVFFADALSEASGVDIESVVNQNRVHITVEKTQTPIDFVLLEYINEYMRL